MKDFKGKTAIVTGAGSGMGAATAAEFVAQGMNVVLADIQAAPLEAMRRKLADAGGHVASYVTDVSDPESVQALAHGAAETFGDIHVAFNNAGVAMHGTPMIDIALADWRWVVDVNILGMVNCIKSFTPLLMKHGNEAHIVNTASIGGLQVNPAWQTAAYSMSKYAAVALSEGLKQELAATRIGVSVLCPGAVATQLGAGASRPARFGGATEMPQQQFLKNAIAGGMRPERVAQLVVKAIVDEQFFIFTDSAARPTIEARHVAIQQAFDRADRLASEFADK
jgi:NAD(P)-dependent dehydrogenase (short-subunit alcohol dehydrogenase family)